MFISPFYTSGINIHVEEEIISSLDLEEDDHSTIKEEAPGEQEWTTFPSTSADLERFFKHGVPTGYTTEVSIFGTKATYGEIRIAGVNTLFEMATTIRQGKRPKVFLDIGSGVGKAPIAAVLQNNASESYGIELCEARHGIAVQAVQKLGGLCEKAREKLTERLQIVHGDILEKGVYFIGRSDLVWISNLCLPNALNYQISRLLDNYLKKDAVVISSAHIPLTRKHTVLSFDGGVTASKGSIAQSFDESHKVFVYHVKTDSVCYGRDIDWGEDLSTNSEEIIILGENDSATTKTEKSAETARRNEDKNSSAVSEASTSADNLFGDNDFTMCDKTYGRHGPLVSVCLKSSFPNNNVSFQETLVRAYTFYSVFDNINEKELNDPFFDVFDKGKNAKNRDVLRNKVSYKKEPLNSSASKNNPWNNIYDTLFGSSGNINDLMRIDVGDKELPLNRVQAAVEDVALANSIPVTKNVLSSMRKALANTDDKKKHQTVEEVDNKWDFFKAKNTTVVREWETINFEQFEIVFSAALRSSPAYTGDFNPFSWVCASV